MTKKRIEKELDRIHVQLARLQIRQKDLEEERRMAERAEKIDIIEKNKISAEKLHMLVKLSEEEIKGLLAARENEKERKVIENEAKINS